MLYLFDRGYPSAKLIKKLSDCGSKYVFRCDKTFIRGIETDGDDCVVTYKFKTAEEALTFRIVRLGLTSVNGDSTEEFLITNLSEDSFSKEELGNLYHLRWGIETSYEHAKNAICLENFSGTSVIAIMQDYYASMYLYNLSAGFAYILRRKKTNMCFFELGNRKKHISLLFLSGRIDQLRKDSNMDCITLVESEVDTMVVSYKKLWKLLIDKDMKKKDLEEQAGVSHYTMNKLTHGDNVTIDILLYTACAVQTAQYQKKHARIITESFDYYFFNTVQTAQHFLFSI